LTGDAPLEQFKRHQVVRRPFLFLLEQGRTADEITLREVHSEDRARLERRGLLVNVVAVQKIANLQAQKIARPKPAGLDDAPPPGFQQGFPDRRRLAGWDVELVADLAGMPGPC